MPESRLLVSLVVAEVQVGRRIQRAVGKLQQKGLVGADAVTAARAYEKRLVVIHGTGSLTTPENTGSRRRVLTLGRKGLRRVRVDGVRESCDTRCEGGSDARLRKDGSGGQAPLHQTLFAQDTVRTALAVASCCGVATGRGRGGLRMA